MNPQTHHKATDIGCGCVALGEHVKGDSKTYLILRYSKLCVYQLSILSKVIGYSYAL